jgi:hypothetical protein
LAKLKYIVDGIIFVVMFVLFGGFGYMTFHVVSLAKAGGWKWRLVGVGQVTNVVAALLTVIVVLAVFFVPSTNFIGGRISACFCTMIIFNLANYLWIREWIGRAPAGRQKIYRWMWASALVLVAVVCGNFIFEKSFSQLIRKLSVDFLPMARSLFGLAVFGVCATLFIPAARRLAGTLHKLKAVAVDTAEAVATIFLMIGLLYLSLTSYAYAIFPRIPVERGGANFCDAPIMTVTWPTSEDAPPGQPPANPANPHKQEPSGTTAALPPSKGAPPDRQQSETPEKHRPNLLHISQLRGIAVYTTADTVFVAVGNYRQLRPCAWVVSRQFPPILGIPKAKAILRVAREPKHLPDQPAHGGRKPLGWLQPVKP